VERIVYASDGAPIASEKFKLTPQTARFFRLNEFQVRNLRSGVKVQQGASIYIPSTIPSATVGTCFRQIAWLRGSVVKAIARRGSKTAGDV
jgi:hypothetical protein